ncbi:MAG: NAD(P)H-binding protein [Phycisphaerales bacterium]|nr:NAD(P)H-binding protein [Phycisphaerales bacterium]
MSDAPLHVVTGALGYTGKAVTERLLARGARVRTLTNSPSRANPFGARLEIHPLAFDAPAALEDAMRGADVLYNTYWVRFNHRLFTFDQAVANTKRLFEAARLAGVRRIVHVSILHADEADDLGYYRGKHALEDALRATGVPHGILRPGVLFGRGDILINNIAWTLRRLRFAGVFGNGQYALRPLHVDDMADLILEHAFARGGNPLEIRRENSQADAVGPERFTYRELLASLTDILGLRRCVVRVPPRIGWLVSKVINPLVGDVVITWEEIVGMMRNLLDSDAPPAGMRRLTDWAREHRESLGHRYASEVGRRVRRDAAYELI